MTSGRPEPLRESQSKRAGTASERVSLDESELWGSSTLRRSFAPRPKVSLNAGESERLGL
jgi:hypothetical protein